MHKHPMMALFLSLALPLWAACGSSPAGETGGSADEDGERWVAGTPMVTRGEGLLLLHYVAGSADGPWRPEGLTSLEVGDNALAFGQVHRVEAHMESREGIMDGPDRVLVVTEILESRPGGPPVGVTPGQSAGGLMLDHLDGPNAFELGPYEVLTEPTGIRLSVDAVGGIRIGETTYEAGQPLDAFLATLNDCERQANRGATVYSCDGVIVTQGGPVPDHNVNITIVAGGAGAGSASPNGTAACRAATVCDACLAIDGCNWTAESCSQNCMEDTDCYGPGNRSAPTCPAAAPRTAE